MAARILIVDDEPAVRAVLGDFLVSQGYDAIFAESAMGALGAVREHRPHLVLLDLHMPGAVHGDAIIGPISKTVPVVIITGGADYHVAQMVIREGAVNLIRKPFDLARVLEVVRAVLLANGK